MALMVSRAAHYRAKAKHDQRQFGHTKPTLRPVGTDTAWITEFVSAVQGLDGEWNQDSIIAVSLGPERVDRLRQAARLGVVVMRSVFVEGSFVEYRWRVASAAQLPPA